MKPKGFNPKDMGLGAKIFLAICILVFQGCAITQKKSQIHYLPGEARLFTPGVRQELFPEQNYFNGERPELGLALSGGGVRSASFSIGALAGLQESGVLRYVDAISTVSGGGYAGYWFMNSLYELEKSDGSAFNRNELFEDCYHVEIGIYDNYRRNPGDSIYPVCDKPHKDEKEYRSNSCRFQYHIAQRTDMLYYSQGRVRHFLELSGKVGAQIPSAIIHNIANSIFDWGVNSSMLRKYYQNAIERTYGLIPVNIEPEDYGDRQYYNADSSLKLPNAKTDELTFQQLKKYTEKRWEECSVSDRDSGKCERPPLWIINATAGVANRIYEWMQERQPLSRTVFPITPFSYGSGEFGFVDEAMEELSVPKAVSISGAAVDSQMKNSKGTGNFWLAAFEHSSNINLGYSIDNYNPSRSSIGFHRFLPWPFYYLHGFTRNKDSVEIYLSDGGHSENLGAYSLIIRGIPNIIVIDAEHDSEGNFEALTLLKKALRDEKLELFFSGAGHKQSDTEFLDMLKGRNFPYVFPAFSLQQFGNGGNDVPQLCKKIIRARYDIDGTKFQENTIEWLNGLLEMPDLYDKIITNKPDLPVTKEISKLEKQTRYYRSQLFKNLEDDKRDAIKRLNRLTIEQAHPHDTPISPRYDPHDTGHSVFYFQVKGFQPGYISADKDSVDIIYVKASLNPALVDGYRCNKTEEVYPCTVAAFYEKKNLKKDRETSKKGDNLFPQHITGAGEAASKQEYYYAYRDLASYLTSRIRLENGKLSFADEIQK